MKRHAPLTAQRGVALWMLLILVAMAGGYAFYRSANSQFTRTGQDNKLAVTLAQAKEAVIAYAVMDDKRPGRILCPDLLGDGETPLLNGSDCDAYIGGLPWKTLDVRDFQDDHGTPLQLAVHSLFGGRDRPINSDTTTAMSVIAADNSVNDDVVAIVIATRGALDPANSDGDDTFQVGKSATDGDNDLIAVITRQELMAAVEKRVANEVRSCLDLHAASTANTDHRYPWPAPLSASAFEGKANSLFGWVPATQPTAGPESALKETVAKLTQTLSLLSTAPDASQQMTALNALSDTLLQARNLLNAIFVTTDRLRQLAQDASDQLYKVDQEVFRATRRGGISPREGRSIENALAKTSDSNLDNMTDQIAQLGLDVFPWQLGQYATALGRATTPTEFANLTLIIRNLLQATATPRPDIDPTLAAARTSAILACNPSEPFATTCDGSLASADAGALADALATLQISIEASRVSILASDVDTYSSLLNSLNATLRSVPNAANQAALLAALSNTKTSIINITTGVPAVNSTKASAVTALNGAITSLQAAPANYALIDSSTATAITAITALATVIADNEKVDNNVTHTSLLAAIATYETARSDFVRVDTSIPRPKSKDITLFALNLRNATIGLEIWAKSISANAALVAPLATASAVAAGDALTSITGKNESAALLQAYIDTPNAANQASALAALGETSTLVNALLTAANNLDQPLSSTTASAFPMVWLSSRCDFLLPSASSWWQANQWSGLVFYQISSATTGEPGKLTVNGTGSLRVVALAAGRALPPGQNRATLTTANFLEGINADPSRDGDATAPTPNFTATPPSATFNDRLSF